MLLGVYIFVNFPVFFLELISGVTLLVFSGLLSEGITPHVAVLVVWSREEVSPGDSNVVFLVPVKF